MSHQTILYEIQSGRVLHIEPNFYIKRASDRVKYCPKHSHKEVGAFYLQGEDPVSIDDISVEASGRFGQRLVLTKDGKPLSLERATEAAARKLEHVPAVRFECEGGFGDHLLQAAACLEFKAQFPEKWIGLQSKVQYLEVIRRIEGLDLVFSGSGGKYLPAGTVAVSGRTEYMTDPRGVGFGKQSLYGSRLGLASVQRRARIIPEAKDRANGAELLETFKRDPLRPVIGIHFASASGKGKTWPLENARGLVRLIYGETDCEAVIFGRDWQYPADSPLGINLSNGTPWATNYEVLLNCAVLICIDSGMMHLARSLDKPYIGLWGGSTPEYIHGETTGPYDIRVEMDCKERLCMECPEGHNRCMKGIKPEMVMDLLKTLNLKKGRRHGQQRIS